MMFALQQLAATPIRLNVANQQWQLSPLTLSDVGELERALPQRDRSDVAPSLELLERWIRTRTGTVYVLWLALRPRHPRLTLSAAQAVVEVAADLPTLCGEEPDELLRQSTFAEAPACWARLFRFLARRFGWTPSEIAALTLAQAQTLLGEAPLAPGRAVFSRQEYRDWLRARDAQVAQAGSCENQGEGEDAFADALTPTAQRLAAFRDRVPEIYAPLSATALSKLIAAMPRQVRHKTGKREFRRPVRRRWASADRPQTHHNLQLAPQINWHLHSLIVALRNAAPPSDVLPASDVGGARIARFQ